MLEGLALKASYGGSPAHKRDPSDFNLTPPAAPREGKTLCDVLGVVTKAQAQALLKQGIAKGLVSVRERNGWPHNVWSVFPDGTPLEAQLENSESGTYHGYPLQRADPLWDRVLERWNAE